MFMAAFSVPVPTIPVIELQPAENSKFWQLIEAVVTLTTEPPHVPAVNVAASPVVEFCTDAATP
jgi:hypothetical protein